MMFLYSRKVIAALTFVLLIAPSLVSAATFERPLSQGMSGTDVSALQTLLKEKGFFSADVTGYFGSVTFQAVASFQRSVGLESLGYVGPATRAILNGETTLVSSTGTNVSTPSLLSTLITQLQQLLRNAGYYMVSLTGVLDQATLSAAQSISSGSNSAAIRSGGKPQHNSEENVVSDTTPIAAPSGFSVDGGNEQAVLSWADPVHDDLAFISIYHGTTSGNLTLLATTTPGTETYTDTGLTNGTTYYYALSATDTNAVESARASEQSAVLSSYFDLASGLFQGTGRVAVWPDASDRGAGFTGQVGSNRNAGEWGPLVGSPVYVIGREMSAHTWLGYEVVTYGSAADQFINHGAQSIYKPAKFVRWDEGVAVADNGSGGAAALPLDASGTNRIRFRLNTLDTQVTDLSLAVVYLNANINKLATVTIVGTSSGTTTPNLLHTATQAVADGWLASGALVSNGGSVADSAYVLQTNVLGRQRLGNLGFVSVPLGTDLPPDDYTVTVTVTTVGTNGESSGSSRAYIGGLFYHSDTITEATSGASMARMGYVSASNDGSANETFYLSGRPVAGGSNRESGKSHGNETQTEEVELLVDGVPYVMSGKSTTRARTSNVATIKTALPHGLTTGDIVTMSGFASTTYSAHEVAATVIDPTTFTYPKSGVNESETADTAGRFIRKGIKLGSSSVQLSQDSNLFHQDYLSGATPIGHLTTTYTLSGKKFTTEAEGVLDIAYRHASSDGVLATYWSGNPSTRGPVYPGAVVAKAYQPEQADELLNADNDSAIFSGTTTPTSYTGKSLTFAFSRPGSDLASIIEIVSTVGNDAFAGDWATFIQDRSAGFVEKLYLLFRDDLGTRDTPAGWTFDYASDRIDGIAPDAKNSSLFVD